MRKNLFIWLAAWLFSLSFHNHSTAQNMIDVPAQMEFAAVQINLNEDARRQVKRKIEQMQNDANFLAQTREKVFTFMPVVMKNLKEQGVPEDIAYLALKETEFMQSNTDDRKLPAGIWKITPNQNEDWKLNLYVSSKIDERKHLGVATTAVAKKMKDDNYRLQNWINTILAYGFGFHEVSLTAMPEDKGSGRYEFHGQTNPYLIDLVAYYLVFKPDFKPTENSTVLLEYADTKGKDIEKLAAMIGTSLLELKMYNNWLMTKTIPKDYVVYFPAKLDKRAEIYTALARNNTKIPTSGMQQTNYPIIVKQQAVNVEGRIYDLVNANGLKAIMVSSPDKPTNMVKIADNISLRKFLKYNEIGENDTILPNTIYYLEEKRDKADIKYHRIKKDETHWSISQKYGMKYEKLLSYNRIKKDEKEELHHNLWLAAQRPAEVQKDVRPPQEETTPLEKETEKTVLAANSKGESNPSKENNQFSEDNKGKYYTTPENELIYDVAVKLKMTLDSLRRLNPELGNAMNIPANTKILIAKKETAPQTDMVTNNTGDQIKEVAEAIIKSNTNKDTIKPQYATQVTELIHTVAAGEGLNKIAQQYGVTPQEIMTANGIKEANKIAKNQKLLIKNPKKGFDLANLPSAKNTNVLKSDGNTANTQKNNDATKTETVKTETKPFVEQPFLKDSIYLVRNDNETYQSIEQKLKLAPKDGSAYSLYLKTWNNTDPMVPPTEVDQPLPKGTTVKIAENAVLPSSQEVASAMNVNVNATPDKQIVTNIVNVPLVTTPKDTTTTPNLLTTNVEKIVQYSDYKDSSYIVQTGDGLYGIAKKTGVPDYRYLMRWNNITDEKQVLDLNTRLIVKGDLSKPLAYKPITNGNYHVTQFGEQITEIAKLYNIKPDSILKWNKLAADSILPVGKSLLVMKSEITRSQWISATGNTNDTNTSKGQMSANMTNTSYALHKDIYLVQGDNETLKSIAEKLKLPDVNGSPYYLYMQTWNGIDEATTVIKKGTPIKIAEDAIMPTPEQLKRAMQDKSVTKTTPNPTMSNPTMSNTATSNSTNINQEALLTTPPKNETITGVSKTQQNYISAQPFKDVYVVRLPNETLKTIAQKHNFQPIGGHEYALYMKTWNGIDDENIALPIGKAVRLVENANLPTDAEILQIIPPSSANFDGKHTVAAGETLRTVAKQYNVDVKYLEEWNKINDNTPLKQGQILTVQGDMRTEIRQYDKFYTDRYHVVQRGETLFDISRFHNIKVEDLQTWNNLETNVLKEDQQLWIVPKPKIHKVMHGESLSVIAVMYGLPLQEVADYNELPIDYKTKQGEMIIVNAAAILPKPIIKNDDYSVPPQAGREVVSVQSNPNAPETYYAQFGETVTMVCSRYGVNKIDFMLWNKLSYGVEKLEEGKKYYLKMPAVEIVQPTSASGVPTANGKYKVAKNETLYAIARKFNVTVYQLREWNNLKNDAVKEGDNLIVSKQ
jgi:membrane-bound lytic murein transglycosylase D